MSTIDYGIDLGTTNSAIARQDQRFGKLIGDAATGGELLPSAVHVLADGAVEVGSRARAALDTDPQNTSIEFKRLMGTGEKKRFPASGREFTPEELSAEVLKALVARTEREPGGAPRAAVITIPAMFQLPQCDATRRAAALAGIEHAPLLQEPIAAAIAHSGTGEVRDGSWLVYDLGGGTFDVSLVRCKDGRLQVIDHDGDNHLGGRDFDRAIARKAIDQIRADKRHGEFKRTDPANEDAYTRIKVESERLRLALSTEEMARFHVGNLPRGGEVQFELSRGNLEAIVESLVVRTTNLCTKLLKRNRIESKELTGLVMVGGPTLTPCVARMIQFEVGVEAKHYVDPMTIVARGAALFASTQRLPANLRRRKEGTAIELHLEYEPMTTDPQPLIVGRVVSPAPPPPGLRIYMQRDDGGFSAQPAVVQPNGAFAVDLQLAPSQLNVFRIGAVDRNGAALPTEPDAIKMLHGFSIAKPPLSQSVGVMLAGNTVSWYLRKGAVLPARQTMTHTTARSLKKGEGGEAVHVPMIQGESSRGDRNKVIGVLHIAGEKIGRDLPEGSTVEVTISVDESAQTVGRAYVPALDQWFDDVVRFDMETKSGGEVGKQLAQQKDRLASLEKLAESLESTPEANDARIDEIEQLMDEGDRDSIDLADQMVRMMSQEIDAAEEGGKKARVASEFAALKGRANSIVGESGQPGEKRTLAQLIVEIERALARGDVDEAESKMDDVRTLNLTILMRDPGFWVGYFRYLTKEAQRLGLLGLVAKHVERGERSINQQNYGEIPGVCREIVAMFPPDERDRVSSAIRSDVK